MLSEITTYVQKVFQNKEMWIYIVAFIIGFLWFIQSADVNWITHGKLGL